jgi:hypothetical protein
MNENPGCRHGVPYAEECEECALAEIRERADARYAERQEDFDPYEAICESRFGLPGGGKSL